MTGKIICYKGSIEALINYVYHPDSKRIIKSKDDGTHVYSSNVFTDEFGDIYKKEGSRIEIEESDFDELFER
ncbi:MAG: hypothetical protein Q8Q04_01820, partial [archaeon]|nr:hypothetical protein [archaeon]